MPRQRLLAYDLGTGGIRAALYDSGASLLSAVSSEYVTRSKEDSWAEQDPESWWAAFCRATREILDKVKPGQSSIAGLSFSGQMMGCLPVDERGQPLRDCMIWADRRSLPQTEELKQRIAESEYYQITGNKIYPTYPLPKFMWLKATQPEIYRKTFKFLQPKDFLVCRLTDRLVTDFSDASGTAAFDFRKGRWAEEVLRVAGIEPGKLPEIHHSTEVIGHVTSWAAKASGLPEGLPVVLGAGDGPCANLGAGVYQEGSAYVYLGTSSWVSMAAREPVYDSDMVLFNICSANPGMVNVFGTMQMGGGSLLWLRDTVCLVERQMASLSQKSAYDLMTAQAELSPPGAKGLVFLPYLRGERSPRWNPNATGAFIGLTANHGRQDLIRSVLEGVIYNLRVIRCALRPERPEAQIRQMRVIGGGAQSPLWRQILADVFNEKIYTPVMLEGANTLGAAILAGVGTKVFPDFRICTTVNPIAVTQEPTEDPQIRKRYETLFAVFNACYNALLPLFDSFYSGGHSE